MVAAVWQLAQGLVHNEHDYEFSYAPSLQSQSGLIFLFTVSWHERQTEEDVQLIQGY